MPHIGSAPGPNDKSRTLLVGWISRLDFALELDLSIDTLRRWEAQASYVGPVIGALLTIGSRRARAHRRCMGSTDGRMTNTVFRHGHGICVKSKTLSLSHWFF